MKCILFLAVIPAIISISSNEAFCQSRTYGVPFLLMTPDARGLALGDGGSVFASGATAAYYNPAALVRSGLASGEFGVRKVLPEYTDDFRYRNIYLSSNYGGWGYYGIGYNRLSWGERIQDEFGNLLGEGPHEYAISLFCAVALDSHTSVGAAGKYISSNMDLGWGLGYDGSSLALDLGLLTMNHLPQLTLHKDEQYYPTLRKYRRTRDDRGIAAGISISNWGPDISYSEIYTEEPLPTRLRLAIGYQAIDADHLGLRLTVDATKILRDTNDGFDTEWQEVVWSYGVEGTFLYIIHLRAGRYLDRTEHQRFWTAGFGLGPEWLSLDYAKVMEGDEDWNRRGGESEISIHCNFEPWIFRGGPN